MSKLGKKALSILSILGLIVGLIEGLKIGGNKIKTEYDKLKSDRLAD